MRPADRPAGTAPSAVRPGVVPARPGRASAGAERGEARGAGIRRGDAELVGLDVGVDGLGGALGLDALDVPADLEVTLLVGPAQELGHLRADRLGRVDPAVGVLDRDARAAREDV